MDVVKLVNGLNHLANQTDMDRETFRKAVGMIQMSCSMKSKRDSVLLRELSKILKNTPISELDELEKEIKGLRKGRLDNV